MNKIRVLILVTDLNIGGVPLFVRDLACGLSEVINNDLEFTRDLTPTASHNLMDPDQDNHISKVFDIKVACLAPEGPVAEDLRSSGIETWCLGARGPWDFRVFFRLAALLTRRKPHIVHCCLVHANLAGVLVSRALGIKRVFTSTHTAERGKLWHLKAENLICRLSRRSVCISHSVQRHLIHQAHIPPSRLLVIYYGINCQKYAQARPGDLSEFGLSKNRKTLIFVGRLDSVKNIDLLLEALARLVFQEKLNLQLLIVGGGPERSRLEKMTARLNLTDRVRFAGERRDVARLLKAADLFVLPSKWEGFGLAAAEAMAAGRPVVASRTDGLIDVIDHNANGLLVPPNQPKELTHALKFLLNNPPKMQTFAAAAQKKALQQYSLNTMIKNYARFYLKLIKSNI